MLRVEPGVYLANHCAEVSAIFQKGQRLDSGGLGFETVAQILKSLHNGASACRRPERAALEALVQEAAELPCVAPEQASLEQAVERFDRWQARPLGSRGLLI